MPGRVPIPDAVLNQPIRVEVARELGLSRDILRGGRFRHRTRSLFVPGHQELTLANDCQALRLVLPRDSAYVLGTSAQLHDLPVPPHLVEPINVAVARDFVMPERLGVHSHEVELPPEHVVEIRGVRATSVARTFVDLAHVIDVASLVAYGDAALSRSLTTKPDIAAMVRWARGRRGVRRARLAATLLDGRAESPPESLVRAWLALAGLPPATPNVTLYDRSGEAKVRLDLLVEEYATGVEYDGAYHRDRDQFAADLRRRNLIAELGIDLVHVEASMLAAPASVVMAVAQALQRHGWAGPIDLSALSL